jgi:diguanylate cyclase (GGDEF)-like protein
MLASPAAISRSMEFNKLNSDNLQSPYAKQLKHCFSKLRFTALLEKEFREFYVGQNLPRGRLSGLIALILVLAVTCIDFMFARSGELEYLNTLRLGVLVPLLVAIVVATYLPGLRHHYMQVAAVGVTLAGLVVTYICHMASLDGASYLLAGVVLVILYACLFLGLLFNVAIAIASFIVVAHFAVGLALGQSLNVLLYMTAILATATVIGAISTFNLERALRLNFLETRLLNELAERDGLTGLYNRRIFDDFMRRIWRQSRREQAVVEIIFIDIDSFKIYNDVYGHQAGDDCLKKVAKTIARCAKRPFDFCARYGGEEFVLVLYNPPPDYAQSVPEVIRGDVMDLAISHEGSNVSSVVTVSVGVALAQPSSGRSMTGAIQAADEALYEAKRAGRNRVVYKDASESEVETGNFRASYREMA